MIILRIVLLLIIMVFGAVSGIIEKNMPSLSKSQDSESEEKSDFLGKTSVLLIDSLLVLSMYSDLYLIFSFSGKLFSALISIVITLITVPCLFFVIPNVFEKKTEGLSYFSSGAIRILNFVLYPIAKPISILCDSIYSYLSSKKESPSMTQDELISYVNEIEEDGAFTEDESEIIKGAIKFADITAKDILVPRVDVKAFDINDGIDALINDKELTSYSRIPVYDSTIDNILGILSVRQLSMYILSGEVDKYDIDIKSLLAPAYFVHMGRDLTSLLKSFREDKYQMAIVVDEYGGTMGIITAEDMVEEIVGDIFDEGDEIEKEYIRKNDGYEVDGLMNLDDFFSLVGFDDDKYESDYNTVGGWSAEILGKIPEMGEEFEFENLRVAVIEVSNNRVEKLFVRITEEKNGE